MINLLKILLSGRASLKFACGVILGLAFSMSVILATIGLMDGFENTLRQGLRKTVGDFAIHSRDGFFVPDELLVQALIDSGVEAYTGMLQLEAFALKDGKGHGVLVRGVEPHDLTRVTGLELPDTNDGVVLGSVLYNSLQAKNGEPIVLSFAQGNNSLAALPSLRPFTVTGEVHHGIHQKDQRFIYSDLKTLQISLNLSDRVNSVLARLSKDAKPVDVENAVDQLRATIGANYTVRPYWSEFRTLLQAVQAEKVMIGLVLQVIVVIAIINAAAFIIFLSESRSQELFLFKALGMSQKDLAKGMSLLIGMLWAISSGLAFLMERGFSWLITNYGSSFLPGDIYYVAGLEPVIGAKDYIVVALAALFWIVVILSFSLRQLRKSPVLQGLRKEFA